MGTGRKFNKKPMTRPTKSASAREQRCNQQRARLISLGMPEAEVAKLNVREVRELHKYPAKIQAQA